jgi:hypothetical protein
VDGDTATVATDELGSRHVPSSERCCTIRRGSVFDCSFLRYDDHSIVRRDVAASLRRVARRSGLGPGADDRPDHSGFRDLSPCADDSICSPT